MKQTRTLNTSRQIWVVLLATTLALQIARAGDAPLEFAGVKLMDARRVEVVEVGGQPVLRLPVRGEPKQDAWARLDGVSLTDGTITFQMRDEKAGKGFSHGGIALAVNDDQTFDVIYFTPQFSPSQRTPEMAKQFGNAVKMVPAESGKVNWRKYLKAEYMADAEIPADAWTDYRIEKKGNEAKVFIGTGATPVAVFKLRDNGGARGVAIWSHSSSKPVLIRNLKIHPSAK